MLVNTKAKVGVFSIALGAYLPQFPSLVPEFESQYAAFKKTIPDTVEIIDGGMVTPSFLHKSKKYTLRNHYSIAVTNTQRVNCEILRSLIRQRLCLITFLGMLHFLRSVLFQFIQNLMSIFLEHLAHNIHTAVKCRIIFRFFIIFLQ